jgi:hypothetical protein
MNEAKYIGMDVHQATISVTVLDSAGKLVIEAILETKAETILKYFSLKPVYRTLYSSLKTAIRIVVPEAQNLHDRLINLYAANSELGIRRTECERVDLACRIPS